MSRCLLNPLVVRVVALAAPPVLVVAVRAVPLARVVLQVLAARQEQVVQQVVQPRVRVRVRQLGRQQQRAVSWA